MFGRKPTNIRVTNHLNGSLGSTIWAATVASAIGGVVGEIIATVVCSLTTKDQLAWQIYPLLASWLTGAYWCSRELRSQRLGWRLSWDLGAKFAAADALGTAGIVLALGGFNMSNNWLYLLIVLASAVISLPFSFFANRTYAQLRGGDNLWDPSWRPEAVEES